MAIAPKEPEVFFQRAGYMGISNWQSCFFRHYRNNEEISTNEWVSSFFSPGTIANLKKASELKPKDYQYISLAAYFEFAALAVQLNASNDTNSTLNSLPDATKQSIHSTMTRLENLSEDANKKIAAGALENLGMLNMMFGNKQAAIANSRRAVALDPTRKQSWDLLLSMLLDSPDELLVVAQTRLKIDDSAHNHIVLSKIFAQKMGKWKEATEQAKIAEKLETNNIIPPLLLAAIALKQSEQTNYLSAARTNLARTYAILQKMPDDDEKRKRGREWWLNIIIFDILNDQPDVAKNTASDFLKFFPDDETVKEILKMLN